MFNQINEMNRLEHVATFFYNDTLKGKVLKKWRQVVRTNIRINVSFQEEEMIENNIELNLKYSLQQSAKYILDHVENKTDQYFNYVIEENDLNLDVNNPLDGTMDSMKDQQNMENIQKIKDEEERKRKEKMLTIGRKHKRSTLIDLKRHFQIDRYTNRWNTIYKRKYIRSWKRCVDYKHELANKFFIMKYAPYIFKQWKSYVNHHQTIKKSPKRGGYLEMYLKNKTPSTTTNDSNNNTNSDTVYKSSIENEHKYGNNRYNKSYILNRKKKKIVNKLNRKKKNIYFKIHDQKKNRTLMNLRTSSSTSSRNTVVSSPQPRVMMPPKPSTPPNSSHHL